MTDDKINSTDQTEITSNQYLREKREVIEQDVTLYKREIELVEFVCACPNCTYCFNKTFWAHQNRRYCCEDAMLAHRKRQRIEAAIAAGRIPGRRGRQPKKTNPGIIFVLQATNTNFYIIDWVTDNKAYQQAVADYQQTVPKGVTTVCSVSRYFCQELVPIFYDMYANYVTNSKWIELSEEQAQHIAALLTAGSENLKLS